MNFVIYAPGDYSPNGGGSVALHKLAHNIASLGEPTYIMTSKKNPKYLGIQCNEIEAIDLCKDGIAIYPEVTIGNPFKASKVMRWILYDVRGYGSHGEFGANDLIYKYAEFFKLRFEQPVHGELRANELNLDIFNNKHYALRYGDCFLIKKGNNKEHNHHSESAICLDSYPSRGEHANEYLADVFNRTEMFISYDTATWLNVMASLCGCISVVIPDENVSPEEWYSKFPYFRYGIAYGMSEIKHAVMTRHLLKEELIKIDAETLELTKAFIEKAKSL